MIYQNRFGNDQVEYRGYELSSNDVQIDDSLTQTTTETLPN